MLEIMPERIECILQFSKAIFSRANYINAANETETDVNAYVAEKRHDLLKITIDSKYRLVSMIVNTYLWIFRRYHRCKHIPCNR